MTPSHHLRVTTDGHVLTITLDRPERLNALNARMSDGLLRLLLDADHDDNVRAVVLTGAGRGFCAGADVGDLAAGAGGGHPDEALGSAEIRQRLRRGAVRIAKGLLDFEKPLIAAVNGPCAGAGVGIALACDLVVASDTANFSLAFVRRGLVPDYATTFLLPRLIGLRAARELCLLGDRIEADEALRLGMVTRVVPPGELMTQARAYAQRFVEGAGVAIRLTKRLLMTSFESDSSAALDREFSAQAMCFSTADALEGIVAFLEKREPRFEWR
jgi:2-(1,2-epoxy-1,2-dihydrophenyl)acetyl-CoA isomerase